MPRDQRGDKNPNWKGGQSKHAKGYLYTRAPDHPRQWQGYVFEHILVAEETLGRYLQEDEIAHHKNGIRDDNRPENIEVLTNSEHTSYHNKLRKKGESVCVS